MVVQLHRTLNEKTKKSESMNKTQYKIKKAENEEHYCFGLFYRKLDRTFLRKGAKLGSFLIRAFTNF